MSTVVCQCCHGRRLRRPDLGCRLVVLRNEDAADEGAEKHALVDSVANALVHALSTIGGPVAERHEASTSVERELAEASSSPSVVEVLARLLQHFQLGPTHSFAAERISYLLFDAVVVEQLVPPLLKRRFVGLRDEHTVDAIADVLLRDPR